MGNLLDGKVALVTGAGAGLGKIEAIALAKEGARVVVTDLGTAGDGTGSSQDPANQVVEEIKGMGGDAIAAFGDAGNMEDAKKAIGTAIDTFGSLDILINNAGFCRDKTIFKLTEEDWDCIIKVHLKGHFNHMKVAADYWRDKSKAEGAPVYGRMISTASEAFMFAPFGQPNYAAAKAGIVALSMSTAQVMVRYGVNVNVICPRARTRMTMDSPVAAIFEKPADGFDVFDPEHLAHPFVWLASPLSQNVAGYVFVCYGKQIHIVERPNMDTKFENDEAWTPQALTDKLADYFKDRQPVTDGYTVPPQ